MFGIFLPPHPVLNGQNQDEKKTNQNEMKSEHPFCIVFEVLKVLLIIICKVQPLDFFFLVVLC